MGGSCLFLVTKVPPFESFLTETTRRTPLALRDSKKHYAPTGRTTDRGSRLWVMMQRSGSRGEASFRERRSVIVSFAWRTPRALPGAGGTHSTNAVVQPLWG